MKHSDIRQEAGACFETYDKLYAIIKGRDAENGLKVDLRLKDCKGVEHHITKIWHDRDEGLLMAKSEHGGDFGVPYFEEHMAAILDAVKKTL